MNFAQFLTESAPSQNPATKKTKKLLAQKGFDNERVNAVFDYANSKLKITAFTDVDSDEFTKEYMRHVKDVVDMIDNKKKQYRWMFKAPAAKTKKLINEPLEQFKDKLSTRELNDLRNKAMREVEDVIEDQYIGHYDIFDTADEQVWKLYKNLVKQLYKEDHE